MVEESHALSDFFTWLACKLKGKEMLAIALLMFGLGLGNAAGAFANIGVALMPIGIVMASSIGGDPFLAFLIIYFGLQSGFSIGFANPSILGVAQTMAEIPIFPAPTSAWRAAWPTSPSCTSSPCCTTAASVRIPRRA